MHFLTPRGGRACLSLSLVFFKKKILFPWCGPLFAGVLLSACPELTAQSAPFPCAYAFPPLREPQASHKRLSRCPGFFWWPPYSVARFASVGGVSPPALRSLFAARMLLLNSHTTPLFPAAVARRPGGGLIAIFVCVVVTF